LAKSAPTSAQDDMLKDPEEAGMAFVICNVDIYSRIL
jgi:hypothetical protein